MVENLTLINGTSNLINILRTQMASSSIKLLKNIGGFLNKVNDTMLH